MRLEMKKLSRYIDDLNKEKMPQEHGKARNYKSKQALRQEDDEYQNMLTAVCRVRTLREVKYPDEFFPKRLVGSLTGERLTIGGNP